MSFAFGAMNDALANASSGAQEPAIATPIGSAAARDAISIMKDAVEGRIAPSPPKAQPEESATIGSVAKHLGSGAVKGVIGTLTAPYDIPLALSSWLESKERKGAIPNQPEPVAAQVERGIGLPEPRNAAERAAETVGSFLPVAAGMGAPSGIARIGNVLRYGVAPGLGAAAGGELAPEGYRQAGELAGAFVGGAAPFAATIARQGGQAAIEAARQFAPPVTAAGRQAVGEAQVGRELAGAVGGATPQEAAARLHAELEANPNPIAKMPGESDEAYALRQHTLAQRAGGLTGIAEMEDRVRTANKQTFIDQANAARAAQVQHLQGMQETGDVTALAGGLREQKLAAQQGAEAQLRGTQESVEGRRQVQEAMTGAAVEQAQGAQRSALEDLKNVPTYGAQLDVAEHFRAVRQALNEDTETAVARAEAAREVASRSAGTAAPKLGTVEEAGKAGLMPFREAFEAEKAKASELYDKAKIPDHVTAPFSGVKDAAAEIEKTVIPGVSAPMEGKEAAVFRDAQQLGDHIPFNWLNKFRGRILDVKAETERGTESYRRLHLLSQAVDDAEFHGILGMNAADKAGLGEKLNEFADAHTQQAAMARSRANAQPLPRQPPIANVGPAQAMGPPAGGLRNIAGGAGLREGAGAPSAGAGRGPQDVKDFLAQNDPISLLNKAQKVVTEAGPSVIKEQLEALRAAQENYADFKSTFADGPLAALIEKKPRGKEFELSNAEGAKKILHPGDTGGEDVDAYIKAVGQEKAVPVLNDLASFMLHEKAFPNGVPDAGKIEKWLEAHKTALSRMPDEVKAKFENVASAQRAVDDALLAKRQRLDEFDRSAAASIAELRNPADITKTIGGMIDQKDGVRAIGELVAKAQGNESALAGIKQAAYESILNRFVPDVSAPRVNAMRDFLAAKEDVLKSAGLSAKDISELDSRAAAITQTEQAAKKAALDRGATMKQVETEGKAALKEAQAKYSEVMNDYETGVVGRLINAGGKNDVLDTIKGVFYGENPTTKMGDLAQRAKTISGGEEALHKAINEMLYREFTSGEAGATGLPGMKANEFAKFMKGKVDVLKAAGLSDTQIGRLTAIVKDTQMNARSIGNAKLAGQSATTPDMLAQLRNRGTGTILSELMNEEMLPIAGGAAGEALHGVGGLGVGFLGSKLYGALRNAGLTTTNQIRLQAMRDPDFALALLEKMPAGPDRGGAAKLALRARQMALTMGAAAEREDYLKSKAQ